MHLGLIINIVTLNEIVAKNQDSDFEPMFGDDQKFHKKLTELF